MAQATENSRKEAQEEMMMQKTREMFGKEKAGMKAGEDPFQAEGTEGKSADGYTAEDSSMMPGMGAEAEIPSLDKFLESVFGGAEVHIDTVNIHIGDHMESVNFMGDAEVEAEMEAEETEEEFDEEPADGERKEESSDCCGGCGSGALHLVYVDTDLMEKIVAAVTGIDRKTVAAVLKGVAMYLRVLAEDAENEEEGNGR